MENIKKENIKEAKNELIVRIVVFRSNRSIYAQACSKSDGQIIASASSLKSKAKTPTESAKEVGLNLAKDLIKKKAKYIFDRNGYLYHGQVKALADGLRQGGVNI